MIELELPFPPSVNNLFRNNGRQNGGRVKTARYQQWSREAGMRIMAQRPRGIAGPVTIEYRIGRPDGRRRDLLNMEKALTDALVASHVIEDDSLVEEAHLAWDDTLGRRAIVRIRSAA